MNIPDFDPTMYTLALKPEYVGQGDITKVAGGVIVIFNTETVPAEEYPYYWASGLWEIFDQVPI